MNNKMSKVTVCAVIFSFIMMLLICTSVSAEERLVINDNSSNKVFSLTSDGLMSLNQDSTSSGFFSSRSWEASRMDIGYGGSGGGSLECYAKNHATRPGKFKFIYGGGASIGDIVFTHFDGGSWTDKMSLDYNGRLDMLAGGAYCDGYSWVNASSREYKENIEDLTSQDALKTLAELKPVSFTYKKDPANQVVGFIAEDVPEIVATKDRKGTSPMDFVAILTKVVQEQQKSIADLTCKLEALQQKVDLSRRR